MDLNSKKLFMAILLLVGVLIFLFNPGGRDLWDPDETRYAVVAREMRGSGNWILPHLNTKIYAEKPPLFFWLVNFSVFFLGEDSELANRLPSALAGLLVVFLTFFFGERLFNTRVGFLSGLVLSTCFLFPQLSRWMMMDSLFTLFFLLALFYFHRGYEDHERRQTYFFLAGFFIGLGVLTKGPIAYLPIPILLLYSLFRKELKKAWNLDLLYCFLISIGLVFIWLIPACWIGGEVYRDKILFGQTLGRLIEGGRHFHAEPFYFYFIRFPLEFLPWTVFLPAALYCGLRREKVRRSEFLFVLVWFAVVFLFFTLSKGKKDNYILPLYPSASLMVGVLWDLRLDSGARDRKLLIPLILLTFLFLTVFVGVLCRIPGRLYPDFSPFHSLSLLVSSYLLAGFLLSTLFVINKKGWISFVCLMATFAFFHLHFSYVLPGRFNERRSMKPFSERILKRMEMGDELKVCFFSPTGLYYYTRRPFTEEIRDQGRFQKVLSSPNRVFFVIQRRDLDQLKRDLKIEIQPIDQDRVGHWELILISNR
jgi:4-amino-4-deoxy-L-arabinose transferase-like glycosyltransferase